MAEEIGTIAKFDASSRTRMLFYHRRALSRRSQGLFRCERGSHSSSAETSTNPEILAEKSSFALTLLQTPAITQETAICLLTQ